MTMVVLTLQNVNGDPLTSGKNINIMTGVTSNASFNETSESDSLSTVLGNDTVAIDGFVYDYDYLGSGNVRGDAAQLAAFIRITSTPPGAPFAIGTTFAIDLTSQPGNVDYPNLQNGNTKLEVADQDGATEIQFPGVACFVAGTLIKTRQGARTVETIAVGDEVWTLENGWQSARWVGSVELDAVGPLAPIEFAAGSIGNPVALRVSAQHRILMRGWSVELICGTDEVLVSACHLAEAGFAKRVYGGRVCYVQLRFDHHEIIESNGILLESLYLGQQCLKHMSDESRSELLSLLPNLAGHPDTVLVARRVARLHEAMLLDKSTVQWEGKP